MKDNGMMSRRRLPSALNCQIFMACMVAHTDGANIGMRLQVSHLLLNTLWKADIVAIHNGDVLARCTRDAGVASRRYASILRMLRNADTGIAFRVVLNDPQRPIR